MADKEYLEKDALIQAAEETPFTMSMFLNKDQCDGANIARHTFVAIFKTLPAADVRPVVRAAWQSWEQDKPPFKWYSCDYCGFHALSRSNYCPNCGAKMDGGGKE